MILMSTYLLDEIPFKSVYLHGIVKNPDGSKMSKSKGATDPLEMCAKYGTDALRISLIIGNGPGLSTVAVAAGQRIEGIYMNSVGQTCLVYNTQIQVSNGGAAGVNG